MEYAALALRAWLSTTFAVPNSDTQVAGEPPAYESVVLVPSSSFGRSKLSDTYMISVLLELVETD